jgi:hypothetical protein
MNMREEIERIKAMPRTLRLAGYLARSAAVTEFGAMMRLDVEDDEWTPEERICW